MKKKKEVPEVPEENPRPLNWEELPAGDEIDWNAFGRAEVIYPAVGNDEEAAQEEENAEDAHSVDYHVLLHTALAVLSDYKIQWTRHAVCKRMPKLRAAVMAAVNAVHPGGVLDSAAVSQALYQAMEIRTGQGFLSQREFTKWEEKNISLAFSVAELLTLFRLRLPDVYQDNPVVAWSLRQDACTFVFRDGQKKTVGLEEL